MRVFSLVWSILLIAGSGIAIAGDDVDVGKPPVPPGKHPRILFSRRERGVLRNRAQTEEGKRVVEKLRRSITNRGGHLEKLIGNDPEWRKEQAENCRKRGALSALPKSVYASAFLYQLTGDKRDALVAVETFRIFLEAYPEEIDPAKSWGVMELALGYDWVFELLRPEERAKARAILASMIGPPTRAMFDSSWWLGLGKQNNRVTTNWTPIFTGHIGLVCLAIEGEEGHNPEILPLALKFMRAYFNNGIAPDGAMYEGLNYAVGHYGTHTIPAFSEAMRRRGVDLTKSTHFPRVGDWMAYEILPFGYVAFPLNKCDGYISPGGQFSTYLAIRAGKQNPLNRWLWRNCNLPGSEMGIPYTLAALVAGFPKVLDETPSDLPLCRWFSTRELVFSRSGWGERDAHFVFNANPLGAGHSHAAQGSFCLASNGALFISEEGQPHYHSQAHNLVHIDGKAQGKQEGGLEVFIRSVETNRLADLVDADLKLAYDRVLDGDLGSNRWWWREYNPVRKADRRTLFVRGASGPLLLVADDIRKDEKEREYEWRAHVPKNNVLTADGRTFRVEERYGGTFLRSMTKGATSTLVAKKVPGGTYRAWALVRGVPAPRTWASNTFSVNGVKAPYNTSYFGRYYREGWYWNSILPERKAEIEIEDGGDIRLDLLCNSGGRVALAVFSRDPDWTPGDTIPETGGDFVVLTADSVEHGETPWEVRSTPKPVMDGLFLGKEPPALRQARSDNKTRQRILLATRNAAASRFLSCMAPHDDGDGRTVSLVEGAEGQIARVQSKTGVDLVAGAVDGPVAGPVATDAVAAVVSLGPGAAAAGEASPKGYAVVAGTGLVHGETELVAAEGGPVHVLNDGETLVVRGPGGAEISCLRLGATSAVVNGKEMPLKTEETVRVAIPVLPKTWAIDISRDGRTVTVTGDGPRPLEIEAPGAVEVIVNGVSRYFVRDKIFGNYVYPMLETGCPIWPTKGRITPKELKEAVGGGAEVMQGQAYGAACRVGTVLASEADTLALPLETAGPGIYRVVVGCAAKTPGAVDASLAENTAAVEVPGGGAVRRVAFDNIALHSDTVTLSLRKAGGVAVAYVDTYPQFRDLPSDLWSAIGPFPTPWERGKSAAAVKAGLTAPHPPETGVDLTRVLEGESGDQLRWVRGDTKKAFRDVHFGRLLGVKNGKVCYAVTFIRSPDARRAAFSMGCDWWARAWLNGRELTTDRAEAAIAEDGAQWNSFSRYPAEMSLKKGWNTLLVKCHGGSGSNRFIAAITDPGDLEILPARPEAEGE